MFRGLFLLVFMVFVGASLMIGSVLYQDDFKSGEFRDIYNLTESIKYPNYSCNEILHNQSISLPEIKVKRLEKITCSFSDFMITTGLETAKFGIEFGYNNPQYDYDFYISLLKLYIYSMIIIMLVPILIPLIALIYLLFVGINKVYRFFFPKLNEVSDKKNKRLNEEKVQNDD